MFLEHGKEPFIRLLQSAILLASPLAFPLIGHSPAFSSSRKGQDEGDSA